MIMQTNTYILGMGSNHQAEQNLCHARRELTARYPDIRISSIYHTTPIGFTRNKDFFLNQMAIIRTHEPMAEVSRFLKQLEKECGRAPEDKPKEIIKLDLDILQVNQDPIKATELQRHYYQQALQELSAHP